MSEKLTKSERLRGEKRIEALFGSGRRGAVGSVRFCWAANGAANGAEAETGFPFLAKEGCPKGGEIESVSVLFSAPKKIFKRAHDRNLLKRRMRESYRTRKGTLAKLAAARGLRIDIALICAPDAPKPQPETTVGSPGAPARRPKNAPRPKPAVPDFKTIDDAIERILEQISARVEGR